MTNFAKNLDLKLYSAFLKLKQILDLPLYFVKKTSASKISFYFSLRNSNWESNKSSIKIDKHYAKEPILKLAFYELVKESK